MVSKTMRGSFFFLAVAFFSGLLGVQDTSAKDPVFAMPVSVPLFASGSHDQWVAFANFSIVNTLWLRYLQNGQDKKRIYLEINSVPRFLTFIDKNGVSHNVSDDEVQKENIVKRVFGQVIKNYVIDYFGLKQFYLLKGPDKQGVELDLAPVSRRTVYFNRTLSLRFLDPPYGQSLANSLVTNRNIDWFVRHADLSNTNGNQSANSRNLLYRYYHNMGHLFGFGHYRAAGDQIDVRRIDDRAEYIRYEQVINTTNKLLLPGHLIDPATRNYSIQYINNRATLLPILPSSLRSVMYADINDREKSASSPTAMDKYVFRYVKLNWTALINQFIDRFLGEELSPLILRMIRTSRYFMP